MGSAPVRLDGELLGNLNLVRSVPHAWTAQEVRSATAYADVLAAFLGLAARTRASEALALTARRRFDPSATGEDPDEVNEATPGSSGGSTP